MGPANCNIGPTLKSNLGLYDIVGFRNGILVIDLTRDNSIVSTLSNSDAADTNLAQLPSTNIPILDLTRDWLTFMSDSSDTEY